MTRRARAVVVALVVAVPALAAGQGLASVKEIPAPAEPNAIGLYPGIAPGSEGAKQAEVWASLPTGRIVRNVTRPTLTPYMPVPGKATGAGVIVAPGGGFLMLSIDDEGHRVAQWLADHGVAAFVLKYRVRESAPVTQDFYRQLVEAVMRYAPGAQPPETPPEALADARAAIKLVRSRAREWGVDPERLGFMGFSAGAITTISVGLATDPAERPSFIAPIYGPMGHQAVLPDAPPMFAAIAADDPLFGGGQNDLLRDWLAAKRPAELHVFERGGHGFGMQTKNTTSDYWIQELLWWMQARGYLAAQ